MPHVTGHVKCRVPKNIRFINLRGDRGKEQKLGILRGCEPCVEILTVILVSSEESLLTPVVPRDPHVGHSRIFLGQ